MNKLISLFTLMLLSFWSVDGQNYFDIRLETHSINCETNEVCYNVQIRSSEDRLWRFSGQNYRMFYNGALAEFTRVEQVLDEPYAPPQVVQDLQHLDLSQDGNLNFDEDISWLNYYIDMNTILEGNIVSPNTWTTTSRICFNNLVDVMDNPDQCFEMVWAREELTFNYATAFVEISEWLAVNTTSDLVFGENYFDLNSESGDEACFDIACNNTPPSYEARITLKSNDPNNNTSCYNIELKSASDRMWALEDQNYTLFFDGAHAQFINVASSLDGYETPVINTLNENQVIVDGSGALNFEDNLSEITFSIGRGDAEPVLINGMDYTGVAEFCLDFSSSQAGPDECFEIVFGRQGTSDEYSSDFTQIVFSQDGELGDATAESFTDYNKCSAAPCEDLLAPVSQGDVTICEGDDFQEIAVDVFETETVRWYETAEGGVPLSQGLSFTPSAAGIYYAEAYREGDGCISPDRTAVALIESPAPTLTIASKSCNPQSYDVNINTNASSVTSSTGNVEKQIGNDWSILGIPKGENAVVTLTNDVTGCEREETIAAPDCECALVSEPISNGDQLVCFGDDLPVVSVGIIQENVTVDWYSNIDGGSPLVEGALEYTPQNIVQNGIYTYYAQARSLETGCISDTRTEVTVTVLEPPIFALVHSECASDIQTYSVKIYSNATIIGTNFGDVEDNGDGLWLITNVPSGTDISLNVVGPAGCTIVRQIAAPSCECPDIEAPICTGFITACADSDYDEFVAFVPDGQQIHWYDSPVGGTLLATGDRFKPNLPGQYYVEAVDLSSGCVSQERAVAELVISAVPDLEVTTDVFCENESIVWSEIVSDLNNTVGVLDVFASFGDALNNINPLTEDTLLITSLGAYYFRKTTDEGCYDIEIAIIYPEECEEECLADAGKYVADEDICFDGFSALLTASELVAPTLPNGYVQAFFISTGDSLIPLDISETPEYLVDAPGIYTIHSIVLIPFDMDIDEALGDDGVETLFDLYQITIEGGGDICASLDITGARFEVLECTDACPAFTLNPTAVSVPCFNNQPVELDITFNPIDAIIPEDYQQIFVLTKGPELVIMGAQQENFVVNDTGEYRVHSLVFDETTLDLATVVPGVTTAFEVFDLTIEGGGDICASLDLQGALFEIEECIEECVVSTGSPSAEEFSCIDGSDVELSISFDPADAVIPEGYEQIFVLTKGADLVILAAGGSSFTVNEPDEYRIHSLIYNDETLDLGSIVFGETTGSDVFALTEAGGGDICAALDVDGALFIVEECVEECLVSTGSPSAEEFSCIDGSDVELSISFDPADAVIPEGYEQIFVLTKGADLVILAAGGSSFTVNEPDEYRIHSLIYNDETLDLGSIVFGETTGSDVFALTEAGGGDICAALDVDGALFIVEDCECTASSGLTTIDQIDCIGSEPLIVHPIISDDLNIPDGYVHTFLLSRGEDDVFLDAQSDSITIIAPGDYIAYSFVYNPETFDLGSITFGETEFFDVYFELEDGGGNICASLEFFGFAFSIDECLEVCEAFAAPYDNVFPSCYEKSSILQQIAITGPGGSTIPGTNDDTYEAIRLLVDQDGIVQEYDGLEPAEELPSGSYSVHTLVFNPMTYPVSNIELGITAAEDIEAVFINEGGEICGDIDLTGENLVLDYCDNSVDLELSKSISDMTPTEGQAVTFTIDVTNNSDLDATGVAVVDILPTGYSFTGNVSDGGIAEGLTGVTEILWSDLVIPAGATEMLTFTATVNLISDSVDYKNIAEVVAIDQEDRDSTPDNDDGDQSEDDEDSVTPDVQLAMLDLELIKTADRNSASAGEAIEFNINVRNRVMVEGTNIEVVDVLPEGFDVFTVTDINEGGVLEGNTIRWSGLNFGFMSMKNLRYRVQISEGASGSLINVAQITAADQPDIDSTPNNDDGDQSEDDEDSAEVTVIAPFIDLSLEKVVNEANPVPGDFVQFTITVANDGNIEATGVAVSDMIPSSGYDLNSIRNTSPAAQTIGNTLIWSDNVVGPGEELSFSFEVAVVANGDHRNIAQVTAANEQDIDSDPNNDDGDQSEDDEDFAEVDPFLGDEICDNGIDDDGDGLIDIDDPDCPAIIDLEVTKTVDDIQPTIGDFVNYTITITNNGPSQATNVILRDDTPEGIDAVNITGPQIQNDGVITWTIPAINAGQTMMYSYGSKVLDAASDEYTNVVQVVAADQSDSDSTPDNDDGDQSEDDEDSVTLFPEAQVNVDLELSKAVDRECMDPWDRITYFIKVTNTSDMTATGVGIRDVLPDGLSFPDDIDNGGSALGSRITWRDLTIGPDTTLTLSYSVVVMKDADSYTNVAQIISLDQIDIDSSPDNDDGDQSEDDEVNLTIIPGPVFDLELTKIVDNPFARPGMRVRFDVTVENKGCIRATGVTVKDVLPGGYKAIFQVSDFGQKDGNVIVWEDLTIEAKSSKTLSFTAEVVHFAINCDYINVAEIIAADQEDIDSTPNNDDGDQSEDDEDSAEVIAGFMADLEVSMSADKEAVVAGDEFSYTIVVCNKGPANAFNVVIRDYLPDGVEVNGELNYKGELNGNEISWSNFTFVVGDCVELIVPVVVLESDSSRLLTNSAEIVVSDQVDPDSSPGNGEGDVVEDDFDKVEILQLVPVAQVLSQQPDLKEVSINTALYLEGAFNAFTGKMNTTLNDLGYLPGQRPSSFFAQSTPLGQPYKAAPWGYEGAEGAIYNDGDGGIDYPEDVVDWVLISLRTDLDQESTVFTQAALLLNDGTIVPAADGQSPLLNADQGYYLVVEHRNHLPVMSPTKLSVEDGEISFDFRFNESYTALLGSGQKDVNGIYCVYAANGDQFREALSKFDINVNDLNGWYENNGLNSAYMSADYDLNGDVNVQDQIIWLLNNGVFSDVPR